MQHPEPGGGGGDVPLVLRNVPPERQALARALADSPAEAGDVWWELVDAAGPPDRPPAGVALTRAQPFGVVHVVTLAAANPADVELLGRLLFELVAALRCTATTAVSIRAGDPAVASTLAAEDFRLRPGSGTTPGLFVLEL